ncbi:MAG: sulfatase-like hydrolase/transferase [Candidatus Sumerlaeia bacterium]|nr:sulfatase-like hydrolase/transferase [Candidatus Sumerlaeia bacterium]
MSKPSLTRRRFMKTTSSLASGIPFFQARKVRKPNLLFLWTDEQRPDTMAVYGNTRIQAPNLNRFATECFVFEHAYVSQPVCTPSRSTVLTGQWPHASTCVENNIPLPAQIPCFPEILNDPEYRTGYFGKWHLGDEIFPQHGFQEWESIEDQYAQYYSASRDKNATSSYCRFLLEKGYKPDQDSGTFSRNFCSRLPIEHCKPKFLEMKACDFLKRHRNEPFILYVNFLEPHMPFNGPLNNLHDWREVTLPPNFDDPLEDNEPQRYRRSRAQTIRSVNQGCDLSTVEGWRQLIARYWGLVAQVDRSVGAILKTLADLGLDDDTLVVYTSDHGDMMGSHRMLAKTVMYQESVGVPWLMRIPSLGRRQRIVRGHFSHIDLVPTLLDLMGHPMEHAFPGQSLVPLLRGGKVAEDHVYIQWNHRPAGDKAARKKKKKEGGEEEAGGNDFVRTVIAPDGWKLCLSDRDKCQLFDLNRDPYETTNLFDSGRHEDVIRRLRQKIVAWQKRVNDPVTV